MGRYFNLPEMTAQEKCFGLIAQGAISIDTVPAWTDVPDGQVLVCVGDRGVFQYAAYIYDEREYQEFTSPKHTEPQHWFLLDKSTAEKLVA